MLIKNLHTCVYRIGFRSSFLFLSFFCSCPSDAMVISFDVDTEMYVRRWLLSRTFLFHAFYMISCLRNTQSSHEEKKLTKKASNRNGFDNNNEIVFLGELMCGSSSDDWNPFEIVKLNSSVDFFPLLESRKKHQFWIHCPFDVWEFVFVFLYSNSKM